MPIMPTVMAVKAAIGLMTCIIEKAAKTATKVSETKIIAVPIAKFLWLNSLTALYLMLGLF
jgi:hypothetical protein